MELGSARYHEWIQPVVKLLGALRTNLDRQELTVLKEQHRWQGEDAESIPKGLLLGHVGGEHPQSAALNCGKEFESMKELDTPPTGLSPEHD